MASRHQSYLGATHDRYMAHNEHSTIHKMKETYWTTKQAVMKKLGKKEDEHVVASDAELDAKLEVFSSIEKTTMELLRVIEKYQNSLYAQSQEENAMGRFLKTHSQTNKTRAGKMMAAVGKAQSFSSQQRLSLRVPLVRLYQEVETFRYRAITDTLLTINRMETARTEYRGALMWMKDASDELDPDTFKQLEKFRKVQAQVKKTKAKFDKLKLDTMQKIDLLAASRCNMYSHVLANYQTTLLHFWEKTSRTMTAVADSFKGYQYYEFNMLKELAEPTKKLAEETGSQEPAERDTDSEDRRPSEETSEGEEDEAEPTDPFSRSELSKHELHPEQNIMSNSNHNLLDFDIPNGEMVPSLLDLPSMPMQDNHMPQLPQQQLQQPHHSSHSPVLPEVPLAPGALCTSSSASGGESSGWNSRTSVQQAIELYGIPPADDDTTNDDENDSTKSSKNSHKMGKGSRKQISKKKSRSNSNSSLKPSTAKKVDDDDDELISLSVEENPPKTTESDKERKLNQDIDSLLGLEGNKQQDNGSLTNLLQAVDKELAKTDKPVKKNDGSGSFIDFEEEDFEPEFDIEEIKRKQDAEFDLNRMPSQKPAMQGKKAAGTQDLLSDDFVPDDSQKDDMTILNEILNAPSSGGDDFSREWQAVFGPTPMSAGNHFTPVEADQSQKATFLPSSLLDIDNQTPSAAGSMATSAPAAAAAPNDKQTAKPAATSKPKSKKQQADMSAWFNLFADLDPLANPDAVGKTKEQVNDAL